MRPIPLRLLKQSITWEARSAVDDHGLPTYATAVTVSDCMDARGDMEAISFDGEVVVPRGRVVIGSPRGVGVLDRVTLPDGLVARVLQVLKPTGPSTSTHHETVIYG